MKRLLIVLAGVVVAVSVGLVALTYKQFFGRVDPLAAFEMLVTKPIPGSVRAIEEGHLFAMDSNLRVLRFQISPGDLRTLLEKQHFTSADEREEFGVSGKPGDNIQIQKADYFKRWQRTIESSTELRVNFAGNWQIYKLREGNGEKHVFFHTNSCTVVFVAEAH